MVEGKPSRFGGSKILCVCTIAPVNCIPLHKNGLAAASGGRVGGKGGVSGVAKALIGEATTPPALGGTTVQYI